MTSSEAALPGRTRDRTLAVFMIGTVVAFFVVWARSEMTMPNDHDGHWYTAMAEFGISESVPAPFRNRPLSPALAALLPLPWGVVAVTSVSLGVAAAATDRMLRRITGSRVALIGVALLMATTTVQATVSTPSRVDAATLAFACVVLALLLERKWVAVAVVMPFAVTNHELAMLLVIPIVLSGWREKRLLDAGLVVALSAAAYWVWHRSGVLPVDDRATFFHPDVREQAIGRQLANYRRLPGAIWTHYVQAFGVAGFVAWFGWKRAPQLARDAAWMFLPAALLCLGATDWYRMMVTVAPVAVLLACVAIREAAHRDSGDRDAVVAADPPVERSTVPG